MQSNAVKEDQQNSTKLEQSKEKLAQMLSSLEQLIDKKLSKSAIAGRNNLSVQMLTKELEMATERNKKLSEALEKIAGDYAALREVNQSIAQELDFCILKLEKILEN